MYLKQVLKNNNIISVKEGVKYPATLKVVSAGFTDTFRKVHPDEIKTRGYTWTNKTTPQDPNDFHDRIDFVFSRGVEVIDSKIVGENQYLLAKISHSLCFLGRCT